MFRFFPLYCFIILISCVGRQTVELRTQQKYVSQISIHGGSGESVEDAAVISRVSKQTEVMDAEYEFISKKHGPKYKGWRLTEQTIVQEKNKTYDIIEIQLIPSSEKKIYYFNVSAFPWKK